MEAVNRHAPYIAHAERERRLKITGGQASASCAGEPYITDPRQAESNEF